MGNVFQKNGRWYLCSRTVDGKRQRVASVARNKTEAVRLLAEWENKVQRQRLGLEALPEKDEGSTFKSLMQWWLTEMSEGSPSHASNVAVIAKHLLSSELAALPLSQVTPQAIEALLQRKGEEELGPQSLNHLRGFISRAFNDARRIGRYRGSNPCTGVTKRKVPRGMHEYLRAEEVPRMLAALDARWRPLFATAVFTGMRKGELLALRKSDVDLAAGLISVRRSNDRDTTKGGHADAIPVATELAPYLEAAIEASPSELVFPSEDGSQKRGDTKLAEVLRRALARAGIVTGYRHKCRKRGCEHAELAPDADVRRCPAHNVLLWPKALVRPIRFHDLRHTTASLMMMAGASPAAVQRILRHTDPKMTQRYTHLAPEFLRGEIDRLSFGLEAPISANPAPNWPPDFSGADSANEITPNFAATPNTYIARPAGLEPTTLGLEGQNGPFRGVPGPSTDSLPLIIREVENHSSFRAVPGLSTDYPRASPQLAPRFSESLPMAPGTLLKVAEVAAMLRCSTATVYGLVGRRELPSVRVSNAIRVSATDLGVFIKSVRTSAGPREKESMTPAAEVEPTMVGLRR